MNFRPIQFALTLIVLAFSAFSALAEAKVAASQPNILFIITDQQHANMLSSAGNPYLQTPALDKLAKNGIRFTNAYVTNPVCVPSRNSMMTGMMAGRFGNFSNKLKAVIPQTVAEHSMGNMMKNAGYDTFYGGKTHLNAKLNPRDAGYDQ